MDKTAMQTLVEEFDNQDPNRKYTAQEVVNYAVELLEKEKQQIIDAHFQGMNDGLDFDQSDEKFGKQYYNQTYNTTQP